MPATPSWIKARRVESREKSRLWNPQAKSRCLFGFSSRSVFPLSRLMTHSSPLSMPTNADNVKRTEAADDGIIAVQNSLTRDENARDGVVRAWAGAHQATDRRL